MGGSMYLGIDFLLTAGLQPCVVEVNMGLPGGAQEYDFTHLVCLGGPSDIFTRIEETSLRVYGRPFRDALHALPFIESLKTFKIWMDGRGPFPRAFHPGLRLEDKWVQYQLLSPVVPMPETIVFVPENFPDAEAFLERKGRIVLKRRLGRGGRNFKVIDDIETLRSLTIENRLFLLQEHVDSRIDQYVFSIRAIVFGGEFMCMHANLSTRPNSNHGILAFVSGGDRLGFADREWKTESFHQKSWEAEIWFGGDFPPYLEHNLFEEEVARTILSLPGEVFKGIEGLSVKIERFYEKLDFSNLPAAIF